MNDYAVIRAFGKLYGVQTGDVIQINSQITEDKKLDDFFNVLLYSSGQTTLIGQPTLKNVKMRFLLVGSSKSQKIKIRKFKPKVRYRRNKGYRQMVSKIKIDKIDLIKSKK